jgi:hypothetical protein
MVLHARYRLFDIGGVCGVLGMSVMLLYFTLGNIVRLYREEQVR